MIHDIREALDPGRGWRTDVITSIAVPERPDFLRDAQALHAAVHDAFALQDEVGRLTGISNAVHGRYVVTVSLRSPLVDALEYLREDAHIEDLQELFDDALVNAAPQS